MMIQVIVDTILDICLQIKVKGVVEAANLDYGLSNRFQSTNEKEQN